MKTLDDFAAYARADVAACPKAEIKKKVREVLIDFCEQTRILRIDADPITLSADTGEYAISFTADYLPIEIDAAFVGDGSIKDNEIAVISRRLLSTTVWSWQKMTTDGRISGVFLTEDCKARVYPIPTSPADNLYLTCFVKPSRSATEIEDRVYNDWLPVIKDGVLGELMLQPGRPWTAPELGTFHRNEYANGRAEAKGRALQGKAAADLCASYAGSTMF